MNIQEKSQQITENFALFEDWMDKYNYLIELGRELKPMDESLRQEKYLIKGCQARVWLVPEFRDGRIWFQADSDALITKGIVALLVTLLSGQPPAEVASAELDVIQQIGLHEHLSQTRSNGLLSMIKQMKLYGLAYAAAKKQ